MLFCISLETMLTLAVAIISICALFITVFPFVYIKRIKVIEKKYDRATEEIRELKTKISDLSYKIDILEKETSGVRAEYRKNVSTMSTVLP